ncbi:MAG: c-type cytochrome [Burkholderiaceae bacterium]
MRVRMIPLAAMLSLLSLSPSARAATKAAPDDSVKRGEYLSQVAHCTACHTNDPSRPFAGNYPIKSPFGTMYGANITPDRETGIGTWTEKDFEGAMRRGVRKDGAYLYPAMPYLEFTKISDADIHALYAYFRTVKPVQEKTKDADMKFPFDVRLGIAGWQAVYFKQGRYVDDESQSPQWNRGAYLVQGLGHCDACHTPTNLAMAPKTGKALQGNVVDHWFAPDISGDQYSGIAKWSEPELVQYLKTGHNKQNDAAVGPMAQTIDLGLSHLDQSDLQAIASYLKNQHVTEQATRKPPRPVSVAEKTSGKQIFSDNCASCHGDDGKGVNGIAPTLVGAASTSGAQPQTAIRAVLQGFAPHDRWGVMPSFAQVFGPGEVSDVVNYVRTAWGNNGGGRVDPSLVTSLARYSDLADSQVESALICPSTATTRLDAATIAQIKAFGTDPKTPAATQQLVRDYRSRYPKADSTNIVTAISGAYCRNVMSAAKGTLAERQQRYVQFMGNVSQAVAAN